MPRWPPPEHVALAQANRCSEEMRLLTRRLINAQESERRAIARQLHDQLGQTLTVARLLVESTLAQIEDRDVSAMLREAMAALESGLKETRTLTGNLRPPMLDDLGVVPTLRWLVDRSTTGTGIAVILDLPGEPGPLISEVDVAIYRIAQEAIDNALQHGAPKRLKLRLRRRSTLVTLSVEDDGCGFDAIHVLAGLVPFGRSGLLGARERAESLGGGVRVRSQPGRGTVVRAILPRTPPERHPVLHPS
ncbi:MAG: sensor histidine kinase [Gammaproteobacteria bacterium]|nr:sensor histidine kinase [Gammaproteobacteria bacterium]